MTFAGIMVLICWLGFFSFGVYSYILHFKIVQVVNSRRAGADPLDLIRPRFGVNEFWSLFRMYRTYFPSGALLRRYWIANLGAILCFLAAVFFAYLALK
jgi:hypothetical protein